MKHTNCKLEAAIEDLRIKYERIRMEEQKAKEEKEAAERAKAAEEKRKADENDWTIEDPELERLRQARIASLKENASLRKGHREAGHGDLREIVEDDFLKEVTSTGLVVVHFFHPEFETCKVMDKHLRDLAARALQTKFLRLNATKSPFFVAKLKVRTLPTLVYFKEGIAIGRQLGYEGLRITASAPAGGAGAGAAAAGGLAAATAAASTDFSTASLARAMRDAGVLGTAPIIGRIDEDADVDDEDDDEDATGPGGRKLVRRAVSSSKGREDGMDGSGSSSMAMDAAAAIAEARAKMLRELEESDDF